MNDPASWQFGDGPPEDGFGDPADPEEESGLPEPIDRDERAAQADFLAEIASADPEADPLDDVERRGGYGMGCSAQSSNPGNMLGSAERANL